MTGGAVQTLCYLIYTQKSSLPVFVKFQLVDPPMISFDKKRPALIKGPASEDWYRFFQISATSLSAEFLLPALSFYDIY